MNKDYLEINSEVKEALENGKPVVALESTIIAHGMPYPKNVETAIAVEEVIRKNGAVPATIAIIGGKIKIGLTHEEIEYLGTAKNVLKVSRRDFPIVIANKMDLPNALDNLTLSVFLPLFLPIIRSASLYFSS